ncbi:unnamed protein product [Clavelina lepadiformis]
MLPRGANHHLQRESNDRMIDSLRHQIEDLRKVLETKTNQLEAVKKINVDFENVRSIVLPDNEMFADGDRIFHYLKDQMERSKILKGSPLRSEYNVNEYTMFDRHYVYQLDTGLGTKPQDVILRRSDLSKELNEVCDEALRSLNGGPERFKVSPTYRFTSEDFLHGMFRTERDIGTQYELVYKPESSSNVPNKSQLFRVTLFRPFAPVTHISSSSTDTSETIYFIVPLQGREDTFRIFLDYFKDFCIPDGNVYLTVVYFGNEALSEIIQLLDELSSKTGFKHYQVITMKNEEFSRGKALQFGASSLNVDDPLMFFCDVDIGFTKEFLHQCRAHTIAGKSVFYPIVFSLFNPSLVYKHNEIPILRDRQVIKSNNGLWRDFGFGMSCQHLSDFKKIGGFDLTIKGWGTEDTLLFRKYTQSNTMVIRSPVNSLFHHWHTKHCDKTWATEQYESCLRSRARTEGSQLSLGLEYFQLKAELESKHT